MLEFLGSQVHINHGSRVTFAMTAVLHQFLDWADMVMFMIGPGLYSRVMIPLIPRLVTTGPALYLPRAARVCCSAAQLGATLPLQYRCLLSSSLLITMQI